MGGEAHAEIVGAAGDNWLIASGGTAAELKVKSQSYSLSMSNLFGVWSSKLRGVGTDEPAS